MWLAGKSTGYQWFLSVAGEVEGGWLGLAPLELHHPLLSRQALIQLVHSHYMRAALPGLLHMLGASNALGTLSHSPAPLPWRKVVSRHRPFWLAVLGSALLQLPLQTCHDSKVASCRSALLWPCVWLSLLMASHTRVPMHSRRRAAPLLSCC